jgi:polygalacturonase
MMTEPFLRRKFLYGSALLGLAGALPAQAQTESSSKGPIFNVRSYGAVGDGRKLDRKALQAAIDACAAAGGGTVCFPPGRYLSGTLLMKSHVRLYLEAGATLLGSRNVADYIPQAPAFKSHTVTDDPWTHIFLIYGERLENIFIEGHGTLDGQGASFDPNGKERPFLIRFSECRNVTVRGIRLVDSGMWVQHYLACNDVVIDGIRVHSHVNRNNDGIDIDCCDGVRIANCKIDSGDDAICLKSGGRKATRNVTITNCVLRTRCNALKAGTDSESSFENIAITNCAIYETNLAGIALEMVDGARLSEVVISNIAMRGVVAPIFIRLGNRGRRVLPGDPRPPVGQAENIVISNVEAVGAAQTGCSITGLPGHRVRNVTLSNVRLGFQGGGTREMVTRSIPEMPQSYPEYKIFGVLPAYALYCRHVEGLTLSNVQTSFEQPDARPALVADDVRQLDVFGARFAQNPGGGPAMIFRNVQGAMVHGCRPWQDMATYLRVEGRKSEGIALVANDLRQARKAFDLSADVPPGSVVNR